MVRKVFACCDRASFLILTAINDYNHDIDGMDIADQRRASMLHRIPNPIITIINYKNTGYTTDQRALRNWLAFFFFFLDLSTTLAHILPNLARTSKLNQLLDSGQVAKHNILSPPLARPIPAAEFQRMIFKQLGGQAPVNTGNRRGGMARQHQQKKNMRPANGVRVRTPGVCPARPICLVRLNSLSIALWCPLRCNTPYFCSFLCGSIRSPLPPLTPSIYSFAKKKSALGERALRPGARNLSGVSGCWLNCNWPPGTLGCVFFTSNHP